MKTRVSCKHSHKHRPFRRGNTYLDGRLDTLQLDRLRLPHAVLLHVHNSTGITVDTPRTLALGLLGPQVRQHAHGAAARVLHQRPRDHLESVGDGLVRPLLHALDTLGLLAQAYRDGHLGGAATGRQAWVEHDVARHAHGVLQVALDLVEHVLGGPAEQHGAGLGVLAAREEGEVLVANLLDLKQAALGADVRLLDVLDPVNNGRAGGTGDSVVVRLAHAAQRCDTGLDEEVLGEVCNKVS